MTRRRQLLIGLLIGWFSMWLLIALAACDGTPTGLGASIQPCGVLVHPTTGGPVAMRDTVCR